MRVDRGVGLFVMGCAVVLACGGAEPTSSSGGAGAAASAGHAGSAGSGAGSGAAGISGAAGTGGSAGTAGSSGAAGSAGSSGAAGFSGCAGAAGSAAAPNKPLAFTRDDASGLGAPFWGFGIAAADFDGDSDNDAVLIGHLGEVEYDANDGKGHFSRDAAASASLMKLTVDSLNDVMVRDVNRDGRPDLVVFSADRSPHLTVLLGDGAAGFSDMHVALDHPETVVSMAAFGDLDGDGDDDMVSEDSGDGGGGSFVWLWDQKASQFVRRTDSPLVVAGVKPSLVDYDGDGDLDLFVGSFLSYGHKPRLHVFRNDGGGSFVDVTDTVGLGGFSTQTFDFTVSRRFDLDPGVELLTLARSSSYWDWDQGAGAFLERTASSGLPSHEKLSAIAIAVDLNGDGLDDFIGQGYHAALDIWHATEPGKFAVVPAYHDSTYRHALPVDVNGDGACDIIVQSNENADPMPATYLLRNGM
jgi:hypothetical protein